MAKKSPFVFTIGFNSKDPDHIKVANLLNAQGKGHIAPFLVKAVLTYTGDYKSTVDLSLFETMIKKIVADQLASQMDKLPEISPQAENVSPLGSADQKNILNGLAGFRKK